MSIAPFANSECWYNTLKQKRDTEGFNSRSTRKDSPTTVFLLRSSRIAVFCVAFVLALPLSVSGGPITPWIGAGDGKNVVRDKWTIRNKTGIKATDFHAKVSVRDPSAFIESAQGSTSQGNITGALVGVDPLKPKTFEIDITDISVNNNTDFVFNTALDLNHMNQRWISYHWTDNNGIIGAPRGGGGHNILGPAPGGNGGGGVGPGGGKGGQGGGGGAGNFVHPFLVYNDAVNPAIFGNFYVYASMNYYASLDDIPWSQVDPVTLPGGSVSIAAGSPFTFNFETIGAYIGGHIYYKYSLDGDDDVFVVGDHPVPEIDPATGSSALLLVAGVLAMIEQRRRRATLVA
jgi:hypothetical protein